MKGTGDSWKGETVVGLGMGNHVCQSHTHIATIDSGGEIGVLTTLGLSIDQPKVLWVNEQGGQLSVDSDCRLAILPKARMVKRLMAPSHCLNLLVMQQVHLHRAFQSRHEALLPCRDGRCCRYCRCLSLMIHTRTQTRIHLHFRQCQRSFHAVLC